MKQQGFVLLTAVFTLLLMTLLTLSQWQSLLLFQKMMGRLWQRQDRLINLEGAAEKVWQHYQQHQEDRCIRQDCQIQFKSEKFSYRIDPLGIDPCIQRIENGKRYSTAHIQMMIESLNPPFVGLRLRFAQKVAAIPCLNHEHQYISSDLLSWQLTSTPVYPGGSDDS